MSDPHEQFVRDVRAYTRAGERLVSGVVEFNAMNTQAIEDIERGMSLTESFEQRDSAAWSRRISSLLEEFEASRRATRASAAAALKAEGKNVAEVARAFGVSHQLASRFSRVAPSEAGDDPPPGE